MCSKDGSENGGGEPRELNSDLPVALEEHWRHVREWRLGQAGEVKPCDISNSWGELGPLAQRRVLGEGVTLKSCHREEELDCFGDTLEVRSGTVAKIWRNTFRLSMRRIFLLVANG